MFVFGKPLILRWKDPTWIKFRKFCSLIHHRLMLPSFRSYIIKALNCTSVMISDSFYCREFSLGLDG
jgi:hypothetical protein